jgi:hypothetical protein
MNSGVGAVQLASRTPREWGKFVLSNVGKWNLKLTRIQVKRLGDYLRVDGDLNVTIIYLCGPHIIEFMMQSV